MLLQCNPWSQTVCHSECFASSGAAGYLAAVCTCPAVLAGLRSSWIPGCSSARGESFSMCDLIHETRRLVMRFRSLSSVVSSSYTGRKFLCRFRPKLILDLVGRFEWRSLVGLDVRSLSAGGDAQSGYQTAGWTVSPRTTLR